MMRKASASSFHGPMMTMGGQQQLGAAERLRVYRRCFHELDEQLMQLQASGGIQDLDLRKMQAELRALEDLIVIFTDLNSALKAKQVVSADAWLAEAAMEGPDLSLLTDLLFLSASSPWTVYVVERIYVAIKKKSSWVWVSARKSRIREGWGCNSGFCATCRPVARAQQAGCHKSSLVQRPGMYATLMTSQL
ncbi:hypothetical protein CY35_14G097100 [Sphagnum magellanicum]|nr:hypothetical protein CY35_14G097100 [Sphagnum magellanicum]